MSSPDRPFNQENDIAITPSVRSISLTDANEGERRSSDDPNTPPRSPVRADADAEVATETVPDGPTPSSSDLHGGHEERANDGKVPAEPDPVSREESTAETSTAQGDARPLNDPQQDSTANGTVEEGVVDNDDTTQSTSSPETTEDSSVKDAGSGEKGKGKQNEHDHKSEAQISKEQAIRNEVQDKYDVRRRMLRLELVKLGDRASDDIRERIRTTEPLAGDHTTDLEEKAMKDVEEETRELRDDLQDEIDIEDFKCAEEIRCKLLQFRKSKLQDSGQQEDENTTHGNNNLDDLSDFQGNAGEAPEHGDDHVDGSPDFQGTLAQASEDDDLEFYVDSREPSENGEVDGQESQSSTKSEQSSTGNGTTESEAEGESSYIRRIETESGAVSGNTTDETGTTPEDDSIEIQVTGDGSIRNTHEITEPVPEDDSIEIQITGDGSIGNTQPGAVSENTTDETETTSEDDSIEIQITGDGSIGNAQPALARQAPSAAHSADQATDSTVHNASVVHTFPHLTTPSSGEEDDADVAHGSGGEVRNSSPSLHQQRETQSSQQDPQSKYPAQGVQNITTTDDAGSPTAPSNMEADTAGNNGMATTEEHIESDLPSTEPPSHQPADHDNLTITDPPTNKAHDTDDSSNVAAAPSNQHPRRS